MAIRTRSRRLSDTSGPPGLFVAARDALDRSIRRADFYAGDYSTDDEAIRAARNALPSVGSKVTLSEGSFTIGATIPPADYFWLQGSGQATVLRAAAGLNAAIIGTASGFLRYARFTDFKIDGNRNENASGCGIKLFAPRNCTIARIWITQTDEEAIYLSGDGTHLGWYNWLFDNEVDQCDAGLRTSYVESNWILNNLITYVVGYGYYTDWLGDNIVYNIFDQITGEVIHVDFGSGYQNIVHNRIANPATDVITLRGADNVKILENRISELATDKVAIANGQFVSGSDHCDNMLVRGNTVLIAGGATGTVGIKEIEATDSCSYIDNDTSATATPVSLAASTNLVRRDNKGYITENGGAAASVSDGGTIAHGLATTPTYVSLVGSVAEEHVSVSSLDGTNITVAIKADGGGSGSSQTIYWRAWV